MYILVNKRNDTKIFFKIYLYVKPKTIVYYHLRQCLRETRLSNRQTSGESASLPQYMKVRNQPKLRRVAFILTKQIITSCSVTEKFQKVNFPSHDRVCDDRIGHLNHLLSLIVPSTKVNKALADHFNVARSTISRLMIRLRQTP